MHSLPPRLCRAAQHGVPASPLPPAQAGRVDECQSLTGHARQGAHAQPIGKRERTDLTPGGGVGLTRLCARVKPGQGLALWEHRPVNTGWYGPGQTADRRGESQNLSHLAAVFPSQILGRTIMPGPGKPSTFLRGGPQRNRIPSFPQSLPQMDCQFQIRDTSRSSLALTCLLAPGQFQHQDHRLCCCIVTERWPSVRTQDSPVHSLSPTVLLGLPRAVRLSRAWTAPAVFSLRDPP